MSFTSFSYLPRPKVIRIKPSLADTHISFELQANFFLGLIPLSDFWMPYKALLWPDSIKQTKNTPRRVDWSHLNLQFPECPPPPPSALSHRTPLDSLLFHPLQRLLQTSFSSSLRPRQFPTSWTLTHCILTQKLIYSSPTSLPFLLFQGTIPFSGNLLRDYLCGLKFSPFLG